MKMLNSLFIQVHREYEVKMNCMTAVQTTSKHITDDFIFVCAISFLFFFFFGKCIYVPRFCVLPLGCDKFSQY